MCRMLCWLSVVHHTLADVVVVICEGEDVKNQDVCTAPCLWCFFFFKHDFHNQSTHFLHRYFFACFLPSYISPRLFRFESFAGYSCRIWTCCCFAYCLNACTVCIFNIAPPFLELKTEPLSFLLTPSFGPTGGAAKLGIFPCTISLVKAVSHLTTCALLGVMAPAWTFPLHFPFGTFCMLPSLL